MDKETGSWRGALYQKTFDDEYRGLRRRCASGKSCDTDDLRGMLKYLYEMEGSDWLGRGEVQNITLAATIAAYESFIRREGCSPAPGEVHEKVEDKRF
ncbi:MAG: hypothetical protein LBF83_09565 [Spirochaetaceae bacterium]|jgi:hypothetical protein|nr:hypothetical protein [Spirochaetaceae bacterium]